MKQKSVLSHFVEGERKWRVVDATNIPLGRLSSEIAKVMMGKHRPDFNRQIHDGDGVIVINASAVRINNAGKVYHWHTGYPGGIREEKATDRLERKPTSIIYDAVKGMLPKNKLSRRVLKDLRVFAGSEHTHEAQKPEVWNLDHLRGDA
ncbi:MAG: 50S ribosomal protein L13 [Candidatus Comchoanobacterales bacterium]